MHCTSGCSLRGVGKCDSTCESDYPFNTTAYVCSPGMLAQRSFLLLWNQARTGQHGILPGGPVGLASRWADTPNTEVG